MKCIKVYPILKKTLSDSLTYWINEDVEIADIIEAPLQNRKIWVVVDSVISVNEAKEYIKSQNFTIRKIENKDLITCRGAHVEEFKCVGVKGINEFSNSWSYLNVVDKKIKGKDGKFTNVKKLPYCKSCNTIAYQKYRDERNTE